MLLRLDIYFSTRGLVVQPHGELQWYIFTESFNRRVYEECLNMHWLSDIVNAINIINDRWQNKKMSSTFSAEL